MKLLELIVLLLITPFFLAMVCGVYWYRRLFSKNNQHQPFRDFIEQLEES